MTTTRTDPDIELEQDARALYAAVRNLVHTYQIRDRQRTCYYDISVTQCHALEALVRRGPMGLNEIAAELRLEKSSASRMVDGLEEKDYVRRMPDPQDGRALQLVITPNGLRVHDRIVEDLVEEKRRLLDGVGKATRRAAIRIVGELAKTAAERFREADDPQDIA